MKSKMLALSTALLAATLALTARAENHINIDLGLRLGPPAPIIVREAPPRPVVVVQERRMESPGSGYVWVAGRNTWRDGRWVWVEGGWVRPPQPNAIYVEGRFDERSRNWTESHWEVAEHRDERMDRHDDHWDRDHRGPGGVELIVEGPPPPRHERMSHRPSFDYVWVDGYYVRNSGNYEWVSGRWALPPHGRRDWSPARWEHRGNGFVFIEGSWH